MIAAAIVVVGLVLAAVVLATRKPSSSPPSAVVTASPSASPSPSPTDTPTPTPTPTPSPTPTPHPTPTATAVSQNTPTQQAQLLFPASGSECGSNSTYNGCPVTNDLANAAGQWHAKNPSASQPLCRCASTYSSPVFQRDDRLLPAGYQGQSGRAAVQASLTLSGGTENIVLLFMQQGDRSWVATDTYCDNPQNRLTAGAPTTCATH